MTTATAAEMPVTQSGESRKAASSRGTSLGSYIRYGAEGSNGKPYDQGQDHRQGRQDPGGGNLGTTFVDSVLADMGSASFVSLRA